MTIETFELIYNVAVILTVVSIAMVVSAFITRIAEDLLAGRKENVD